jgi:hypothetical protein
VSFGLPLEETTHVLHLSVATVEREWQAARAWLFARLNRKSTATVTTDQFSNLIRMFE